MTTKTKRGIVDQLLLAELGDGDLVKGKPIDALVAGTFVDMMGRRFEFTEEELAEYADNTQALIEDTATEDGEIVGIPIDPGGHEEGDGAAGWIKGAFLDDRGGSPVVKFQVEWTEIGVDLIGKNKKRYFSGTIDTLRKVIKGGSLTNWPATRDIETGHILLAPVQLSGLSQSVYQFQEGEGETPDPEDSLDQQVERVRMSWYEQSETMDGPDSWVSEVFDDRVIVQMGDDYFQISYQETEDGEIAFADRDEWIEVKRTWVQASMALAKSIGNQFLAALESVVGDGSGEARADGDNQVIRTSGSGYSQTQMTNATNADGKPHEEDDPMTVELKDLTAEDRESLVVQLADQLGLSDADLQAAQNGSEPGELLSNLIDQRADQKVKAQMAAAERSRGIAQFTEKVTGGEEANPQGLPVQADRLEKFLDSLNDHQLEEAQAILGEIHKQGVTPFEERGHQRTLEGETELEDWAKAQLQEWLDEDEDHTIEEWFEINQTELGRIEDYDLSEFRASE